MSFSHKLQSQANRAASRLCVGLDPELDRLPATIERSVDGVVHFCRDIIDATAHVAAAYKPNSAFFEALGPPGWHALGEVVRHVPEQIPVIVDAKRGDMGNTSRAYAAAFFEQFQADALTVNPYLGPEGLAPFMRYSGRAIFVLCRTSNPGSDRIQEVRIGARPLYLDVASWALAMEGPAEVGLVVGATQPEALKLVTAEHPDVLLLIPGIGAQGGEAAQVRNLVGANALFAVSRTVLYASEGKDFADAAAGEAERVARDTWREI